MQLKLRKIVDFKFTGKPMSINGAYIKGHGARGKAKSGKYIQYEYFIESQIQEQMTEEMIPEMQPLLINYEFFYKIFKKNSKVLSKTAGDVTNCVKPLEDIMANALGFNDAQVVHTRQTKTDSEEEYMRVSIFAVEDGL